MPENLYASVCWKDSQYCIDVVRTRVLSSGNVSAVSIFRKMADEEGRQAFFKGATVKIGSAGPKLAFAMTVAQTLYRYLT